MTFDDLKAKTYQLVEGLISLDDFKDWYREAMAESPQPEPEPEYVHIPFTPPPVKTRKFEDYASEEPDAEMREHHRRMLGSGN